METKQGIVFFNEQKIKEILTAIKDTNECFEVTIKNEENKNYNGQYSYRHKRITLYLLNQNSNNNLIKTAIHEYAHHLEPWVGHKKKFWNCYFELLETAERKGYYSCNIDNSDKLKKITAIVNQYNLVKNRKIYREKLSPIFSVIYTICKEIGMDDDAFQYYIAKYLKIDWYKRKDPRSTLRKFYISHIITNKLEGSDIDRFLQKFFDDYYI